MKQVSIVILNWNGRSYLDQFLPSVIKSTYQDKRILVVDNGSTDDSVSFTKEKFPEVEVLELPENYGFAEGNNQALPHIDSPYLILLNSDVEVAPDWIEPLVEMMEANPNMAACQPKIRAFHQKDHFEYAGASGGFLDKYGYPFCRGRIFDTLELDEGQYEEPMEVFWATGAAMMLRKSVVDQIGLFEAAFFAHMEEIDFCWRALNHGYDIGCHPGSIVYHVGGGTLPQGNPRKTFLNVRNGLTLLFKNLPKGKVFSHLFIRMVLDGIWGLSTLLKGDFKTIGAILKGHFAFYGKLGFWRKRRREIYPVAPKAFPKKGFLNQSIVWQYFGKGKKTWSEVWKK
ncbi:MAG: glycosyltransferase family 2 protein [Bacteroidia bacterium]|nr:glycosyltransferase family 2 protein [Bacteroidia bacterium]